MEGCIKSESFFLNMLMLQIELNGMKLTKYTKISCPNIHPRTLEFSLKVKTYFFLKVVLLHIKLKALVRN